MNDKVLIPLHENDVAPRFDLATDVLIATRDEAGQWDTRVVVLPQAAGEEVCRLVLAQNVTVLICAGISEEFHQFLQWKRVRVIDDVCGPVADVLDRFGHDRLEPGDILYDTL